MSTRAEILVRLALAALLAGVAAWVILAFWVGPDEAEEPAEQSLPDPAAYQVSEVIEEARRITREAAG